MMKIRHSIFCVCCVAAIMLMDSCTHDDPVGDMPDPVIPVDGRPIYNDIADGLPVLVPQAPASEIDGDEIYLVYPDGSASLPLVASLIGVVNKVAPRALLDMEQHAFWCNELKKAHATRSISATEFVEICGKYATGYILYDTDISARTAASLAGPINAVIMDKETAGRFGASSGIRKLYDCSGKDESFLVKVFTKNATCFNLDGFIQPLPDSGHAYRGVDFAIATNRLIMVGKNQENIWKTIFRRLHTPAAKWGYGQPYGDEKRDVNFGSTMGVYTIPSDWQINYSFYTAYTEELKKLPNRSDDLADINRKNVHYVMIKWSDGDNIDWVLKDFVSSKNYFSAPEVPGYKINWGLPPAITQMPLQFNWFCDNTPEGSYFLCPTSGLGYAYPSVMKDLSEYARQTEEAMEKAGLSYLNILDLPKFNTTEKDALGTMLAEMPSVKGVLYMNYDNYAQGAGAMYKIGDIPVVSFRHRLWKGLDPYEKVASEINSASRDVTRIDAYSAVVVHAWSYSSADVRQFIDLLDDDVVLVNCDEFFQLIKTNVK
ncbi:MAG: hypothetical protein MJY56_00190 [Bacteroidales bacterium]|nr:hypothetical protein [Bacteroidales bacterium]